MNIELFVAIKKSGLRQYEIAHKAKISETNLSNIINERRHRPANKEEMKRLSKALGVPIEKLFKKTRDIH